MGSTVFERAAQRNVLSRRVSEEEVWNTASAGTFPDTSPGELVALGDHAATCARRRGTLFTVLGAFATLQAILVARFWTTTLAVALLTGVLTYFA